MRWRYLSGLRIVSNESRADSVHLPNVTRFGIFDAN